VHDIIGPLVKMDMKALLAFTRMTGDFVKAMLNCGKPIISAVDGVAVGAGAIVALSENHADMTAGDFGLICAFGAGYSIGGALLKML
ncbi:MAG: hypothetical protein E5W60_15890, partial [Mesorhizobium sp.]